jgi:hypothetical protein
MIVQDTQALPRHSKSVTHLSKRPLPRLRLALVARIQKSRAGVHS